MKWLCWFSHKIDMKYRLYFRQFGECTRCAKKFKHISYDVIEELVEIAEEEYQKAIDKIKQLDTKV